MPGAGGVSPRSGAVGVVVGLVPSGLVALASALAVRAVPFASALVVFPVVFASTRAVFVVFALARADAVAGDAVVFVLPDAFAVVGLGALAAVVFGAFDVCEAVLVAGADAFGAAFVVFGDDAFVVAAFGACCGFGVEPPLPCAEIITEEASTNAIAEASAVIFRVMNPPEGDKPPTAGWVQAAFQWIHSGSVFKSIG